MNEHEGFAVADVEGDGKVDIVGGGRWFKHLGGTTYAANVIDASSDLDVIGKPYNWDAPRLDVWINEGPGQ